MLFGKKYHIGAIEITNHCQLNCRMCRTQAATRKKGYITDELFETACHIALKQGQKVLPLHTVGEPLLHPRLLYLLDILAVHRMQAMIQTNGQRITDCIDILSTFSTRIHTLGVSIDAADKKTYEHIRQGASWEQLIKGLDAVNDIPELKTKLKIDCVVNRENVADIATFRDFFRKYTDRISFHLMNSVTPDPTHFNNTALFRNRMKMMAPCQSIANRTPFILWNGDVSLCCRDYNGDLVVGNIREQPLNEIMEGQRAAELEARHRAGRIPCCWECLAVDEEIGQGWADLFRRNATQEQVDAFIASAGGL